MLLERLHRRLGGGAELARGAGVQVAKGDQVFLQAGNIVAVLAVAQHLVLGGHQKTVGAFVHLAGLLLPVILLEPLYRSKGAVQIVAAHLAGVVAQILQLLLDLRYLVAL